jgi:hypothetical protein
MSEQPTSYRFGPLERRGLLGGLRASQAVPIALAALVAVFVIDHVPTAAGAVAGLALVSLAVVSATLPLAGGTLTEWAPVAGAWLARAAGGRTRHTVTLPESGFRTDRRPTPALELPPNLAGVQLLELPYQARPIGALAEPGRRLLTVVLACQVASFELLDRCTQEHRLAQWGAVLAGLANTPIRRLQWVERTAPASGDELARWLHSARDPDLPPRGTPLVESYLELIGASARVMLDHEILLAIQLDASRIRGGQSSAARALVDHALRLARSLEQAEIKVLGALSPPQLAAALRTAFDPYARPELAALAAADPERDPQPQPGPLGAREGWDHYRADGAFHATFWVAGWPRAEVSPMFMNALLGPSGPVRTVAITFEPIPLERSTREVEAAIVRDRADSELRHRFGQSETARHRQAAEAAARREVELAAGHGEVRFSGFITVSGRDPDDLEAACADTLQHAARARLQLRRMYGQQASAFTFTLPLARGLR